MAALKKNTRNLKVYAQSGYRYKDTPTIMLKGQWLKDLGFDSNTPIQVKCEDGKLTIRSQGTDRRAYCYSPNQS